MFFNRSTQKDKVILEKIKKYFCVGRIYKHGENMFIYKVRYVKDLLVIINHFNKYSLITQKRADFELFSQAVELIQAKEHLTEQGFYKILVIKASINRGFSDNLKATFPQVIPVEKPNVLNPNIKDPNWLAGFTSGEGCIYVKVREPTSYLTGFRVELIFQLTQHSRDLLLLRELVKFLRCGRIDNDTNAAV